MKQKYLKYTLEELIQDRKFISWVLRGKRRKEWENFLADNQEFRSSVGKARKIVELLRDSHDHLNEEDILSIWRNIERFDNQTKTRTRQINFTKILRYAAILIFAVFVGGAAGYWINNQRFYVFENSRDLEVRTQSRLFLSDGTTVDLEKESSKIAMNAGQQILIDNNQIIDLSKSKSADDSKMNEVVIPFGKKSQLILEDGTMVWLNAGSSLAFPTKFQGKKREVFLEGEAYFEVAHNPQKPFYVNTNEISVKVIGTKFNLSSYKTDKLTETILLEGVVSVKDLSVLGFMKKEILLAPNQKATFNKEEKTISVKNVPEVEFAIAWTEGWFMYSKQDLHTVLDKLQRYYNVQFIYDDNFPATDLITGKLDLKESIEQVMTALSDVADIQYRMNGGRIYVGKKITKLEMR